MSSIRRPIMNATLTPVDNSTENITCYVSFNTAACTTVARQRPRKKQLYNSRGYVTASQTSMFPRQQLHNNIGTVFCERSVPSFYKNDS
jgi:hypothetical protein